MPRKKHVIDKNGSLKTVVKVARSTEERAAQHREGRGTAKFSHRVPRGVTAFDFIKFFLFVGVVGFGVVWGLWWVFGS